MDRAICAQMAGSRASILDRRLASDACPDRIGAALEAGMHEIRKYWRAAVAAALGSRRRLTLSRNALDQLELADRLGYDFAWEVEHHFLEEYSTRRRPRCSSPRRASAPARSAWRTASCSSPRVHPARVAERIAALDLVSRGRVEFGMGESASVTELEPFDRSVRGEAGGLGGRHARRHPDVQDGGCEYHGPHFDFRSATSCQSRCRSRTRPYGSPVPPWKRSKWPDAAASGPSPSSSRADAAHAWVHAYYNAFTKRQDKLTDYVTNPNIALASYFMCAETDEEARRRADGVPFFQFALRYYGQSAVRKRPEPGTVNHLGRVREVEARANPEGLAARIVRRIDRLARDLRRKLRRFETSHIDQVILLNQAGKNRMSTSARASNCSPAR